LIGQEKYMSSKDDDFEKRHAALVEVHRKGLVANPLTGPPDVGSSGGSLQDFTNLLGEAAKDYLPNDYLKKLPY